MNLKLTRTLQLLTGAVLSMALSVAAQAPAAPATPTPAAPPAAAPTWSVGPMDLSGYIDGYYSYNFNTPSSAANGQTNDLYNFNDKTDQFNLSAAKLTLNHDPDPVGAHVDILFGRTNKLVNAGGSTDYLEQAFLSIKPPKAKGFELDFGKFVTSAGAEVIEAKDDWNYSRSILFVWALPYFHYGARAVLPVSKVETLGVQVVNGWNDVTTGGAMVGLTSALVKPKFTWNVNYYGGPNNQETNSSGTTVESTDGARHLVDTTLLLTPSSKFSAYINYDYVRNTDAKSVQGDTLTHEWQGVAVAARGQVTAKSALAGRFEYFDDPDGFSTGTTQTLKEFTATYEYKAAEGVLARFEYRGDFSDKAFFHKNDTGLEKSQNTVTVGLIAFFGPKR